MTTYNLTGRQLERIQALQNGSTEKTLNERIAQALDRGLGALELGIRQRERTKELVELGRLAQKAQQRAS